MRLPIARTSKYIQRHRHGNVSSPHWVDGCGRRLHVLFPCRERRLLERRFQHVGMEASSAGTHSQGERGQREGGGLGSHGRIRAHCDVWELGQNSARSRRSRGWQHPADSDHVQD